MLPHDLMHVPLPTLSLIIIKILKTHKTGIHHASISPITYYISYMQTKFLISRTRTSKVPNKKFK